MSGGCRREQTTHSQRSVSPQTSSFCVWEVTGVRQEHAAVPTNQLADVACRHGVVKHLGTVGGKGCTDGHQFVSYTGSVARPVVSSYATVSQ